LPREVKAQAIPSYTPQSVTPHFRKVECFCFKEQVLKANEARQMPVVFYIDPAVPKDIKVMTMSYTFFETGMAGKS
jgi:cytochrome c oxidase assembly protein subunit 11